MKTVLVIVLILLLIEITILTICVWFESCLYDIYKEELNRKLDILEMSFNDFINVYYKLIDVYGIENCNKNSIILDTIEYEIKNIDVIFISETVIKISDMYVKLSFIDYYKFKRWLRKEVKSLRYEITIFRMKERIR